MSPVYDMSAAGWGAVEWLESRGDSTVDSGFLSQAASGTDGNSTNQMIFNQLKFAAAKSVRTSTIILATFNAIAAFATAMGILYDAYSRERRNNRTFKFMRNGFSFVPATDVFPLVLTLGITVQSTTYAVAQSTGLDGLYGNGCTLMAQLLLPALFIAPYIQLVFGAELTIRGLHSTKPFQPRGKWTVTICMTIVGLLVLVNFLVADFDRTFDLCFASLFFFLVHYAMGCFIALTSIAVVLLICTVVIFMRLHRSIKIEVTERVAASRMVYYLSLAVISTAFMLPFFFTIAFKTQGGASALTLSMVASVVANVSGLMTGGLYLFLKSNTISTIGPRDKVGEYERQQMKSKIRRYDSGDGRIGSHAMQPVEPSGGSLRRTDSEASLINNAKVEEATLSGNEGSNSPVRGSPNPNPLRSNAFFPSAAVPMPPARAQIANPISTATGGHVRKRSYSLFPGNAPSMKASVSLLPATTYSPIPNQVDLDSLKPPPSMGNLINRHRRDSSMASSATVQIGLRLSNVNDIMMPPMALNAQPPQLASSAESIYSLECPEERAKAAALLRPSPLITAENTSSSDDEEIVIDASPKRDPVKDSRMKTLPPVPGPSGQVEDFESEDEDSGSEYDMSEEKPMTLSPTVYAPPQSPTKAKLPSPRGVGFTVLAKSNSTGSNRVRSPRSPPMALPRRTTGDATSEQTKNKDWI